MSNDTKDLNSYQHGPSYSHYNIINLPYGSGSSTYNANMNLSSKGAYELGFELSQPSSELFNSPISQENGLYNYSTSHKSHEVVGGGGATIESEIRVSASPSSSGADHHPGQDSGKILRKREASGGGEDDHRSQKVVKTKKKEEKKQKEPRVSFVTKTEVDHLEDGYRWRKYGQKAVKNSPYPRSYYRCTTQKCNVKKRFERSYQDPTVVITTYESQHNHPVPTNRRTSIFTGSGVSEYNSSSSPNFTNIIINTPTSFSHDNLFRAAPYANVNLNPNYQQQQEFQNESEYELLKEMFPSVFFKQEP